MDRIVAGRRAALVLLAGVLACSGAPKPAPQTPAAGAVAVAPGGAANSGPIALAPAADARPFVLASISVGSFDRTLDSGVRLVGSAFPLPMTAAGVRDMLFQEAGLSPDVSANLDLGQPIGGVLVALDGKRTSLVLAVPARGPAEAARLIDALGKPVMTRGPLTLVTTSGKSQSWVYRAGSVVVVGDEIDGMARGAMLALEARHPGPDDITATLFPDAIAKANGTDVKTAIAGFLDQVRQAQQASAGTGGPAPDAYAYETMGQVLALVGDANPIDIGLSVDPARGLIVRARLVARPGTPLEAAAREVRPFEIDPVVLGGSGAPVMVGAMSIGSIWGKMLAHNRARLASQPGKGGAAALAYYDAFLAAQSGQQSGSLAIGSEAPLISGVFSTPLKDPASAAQVSAALGKLDTKAMDALMRSQVQDISSIFDWTAKQEKVGKVKAMRFRLIMKKGSPLDGEMAQRVFGKGLDVYQGVVGSRLVVTFGRDARARLAAIGTGKVSPAATAMAALTDAQVAAKGRDAFYFFDFAPLVRVAGQLSENPRLAAVARGGSGPIPVIFTDGGDGAGKVWTLDLTLTAAAFKSVGALITSGMMSGAK